MGLKIDWNAINNNNIDSNAEQQNKEDISVTEEKKSDEVINTSSEQDSNDFAMGKEIEDMIDDEKPKVKKIFEGHNKDILSATTEMPNISAKGLSDIPIVANINDKVDINAEIQKIDQQANEKVASLLDTEIEKEKEIISTPSSNSDTQNKTKVVCIGGNEQYYKTVLLKLNAKLNDIEFVKYLPTGGKNAFYTIDAMKPDVILIYYKTQIQDALQFYDAIMNNADNNGVFYRDKYKDKRIIVIAENSISYEIKLREKGVNFYIKEVNPRTHTVDTDELISVIRNAKKDIDSGSNITKEQVSSPKEEEEENDDFFNDLPTLNVVEKESPAETQNTDTDINKDKVENKPEKSDKTDIQPAENSQEVLMSEAQWRQKQLNARTKKTGKTDTITSEVGKIIGVYSTTGGAGKTMFASNLASILAKYGNQNGTNNYRVALVEYNLTCKSLDIFFNIKTNKDVASLAKEASEYADKQGIVNITPEEFQPMIDSHMYKIPDINLDILPGISVPLELESIQKNFTTCLFKALKQMYDIVIVDTAVDIAKTPVLEAFNMIDEIYYILPMDVSSIRNTKILIKFFTGMFKKSKDDVKVIINKVNPDNEEFGVDQIYAAFANDSCVPEGTIPRMDREVLSSINRGIPLALEDITNPVANAIYSIALGINPRMSSGEAMPVEQKEEKPGFFGKLFGGSKKKKKINNPSIEQESTKNTSKKKFSMFNSKKKNETLALPPSHNEDKEILEVPQKKKHSLFGTKKNDNIPVAEEPKKKKGLFGGLFGSSKKNKSVTITNKKKKSGLAGILGKGKTHNEDAFAENISTVESVEQHQPIQSRLKPVMRHQPRKR